MAVDTVYHIPDDRQSTDKDGNVTLTQHYMVTVTAMSDTPAIAEAGTGVPAYGDTLGDLTVISVETERSQDEPLVYNVTVTYGATEDPEQNEPPDESNPWNVSISFDGVEIVETIYKDKDGTKITNSAGQPFDPSIEKVYYDEQITVSFNIMTPATTTINSCRGKINSDSVSVTINGISRTFAAKTLKLARAAYQTTYGQGTEYWDVNYVFIYRAAGWKRKVLDQGYYERIAGDLKLIKDKNDDPLNAPSFLNGSGAKSATPVFLEFDIEDEAAFSGLFTGL